MPSAKKERSKNKKAAKRAAPSGIEAAAARIKAANATPKLSQGLEAFLSIDLPAGHGAAATPVTSSTPAATNATATATVTTTAAAPDPILLDIVASKDVALGDARGMYDLVKDNMHDMYVEAGWGWDAAEKWREMEHRDARFLIARWCRGGSGGSGEGEEGRAAVAATEAASPTAKAGGVSRGGGRGGGGGGESDDADVVGKVSAGVREVTLESDSAARCDGNPAGGGGAGTGDSASNGSINGSINGTIKEGVEKAVLPEEEEEEEEEEEGVGGRLAGFCHFRFAWDEDENEDGEGVGGKEDVLYVYELQVAPRAKRRGLGRRMMQALELLANRHGMSKVMLTVFKENNQAMSFYTKKMKYGRDKDSPSNWDQPDEVYEILSKPTRQGAARAKEALRTAALLR